MLFSKRGWRCGPKSRKYVSLPLVLIFIWLGLSSYSSALGQDVFSVTNEGRITAHITDMPLGQALEALSRSTPLDIRGSVPEDERLTLRFSRLTLGEALREMMAGYNYVLMTPKAQEKPILLILGKVEQDKGSTPPSYERTVPVPSSPATASASVPVPPPPLAPPTSAGLASERQAAATQENLQPDSNPEGSAGAGSSPDSEPPFNPAAWGGRGFRGSAPSGRK